MKLPSRLFLVGMPGSGKSTVGKFLAREIAYDLIDLDHRIEEAAGESIASIFETKGEAYFRKLESLMLREIDEENVVIATGGGVPCFNENMDWMNQNGFTIYLKRDIKTLLARTSGRSHRPLLKQNPEEALRQLMNDREPFYQKAGMESSQSEPCEILTELQAFFKS